MSDVNYPILRPRKLCAPNGAPIIEAMLENGGFVAVKEVVRTPDGDVIVNTKPGDDLFIDDEGNEWHPDELVFARDMDDTE